MSAYFELQVTDDQETLIPLDGSTSFWDTRNLRGPAITLALARDLERFAGAKRPDLSAARFTFDLHSPVPAVPLTVRVATLREGRRLLLLDAELMVEDRVVARGRGLFVAKTDEQLERLIWGTPELPQLPEVQAIENSRMGRLYWSEGRDWTTDRKWHENALHKAMWFRDIELVKGESLTPVGLVAIAADMANVALHWGADGLPHINADATVSLARMPVGGEVGLMSLARAEDFGLAVGTGLLFDRDGALGLCSVTAMRSTGEPLVFKDFQD